MPEGFEKSTKKQYSVLYPLFLQYVYTSEMFEGASWGINNLVTQITISATQKIFKNFFINELMRKL
jgi:hypothetical protein